MENQLTAEEVAFVKNLFNAMGRGAAGGGTQPVPQHTSIGVDDSECDGAYGDPAVRKDPKFVKGKAYSGPSFVGCKFSECPSEYLTGLAELFEWIVKKDRASPDAKKHANGKFYWEFSEKDARLARGWSRRNTGKVIKAPPSPADIDSFVDEVAF